ncbi:MAG: xanthine dehydrogenase family protein molybdopterin-binding subunit [Syntrophobacteraceae bacterium]
MPNESDKLYYTHGVPVPEAPKAGEPLKPWTKTNVVGQRLPRVDGYERVSGTAVYPSDLTLPRMLYGAILRCPHPHARIKSVDLGSAKKMDGVHAVISGSVQETNPEWVYSGASKIEFAGKVFNTTCRFEGEPVAAVAAESPYIAQDALRAIRVEYEILPYLADERKALDANAPKIHEKGNVVGEPQRYERGDVGKGFAEADFVHEMTFSTACELHTPMELHGCVAAWDGDRLTIWESTQGVYGVQAGVAKVLGLPLSKVRVIGSYMGGGFGSKLRASKYSAIAALLARASARPVKLFLSREETFLVTGNRPPSHMRLKAGVKKDGTLTALDFSCVGTGGAYPANGTSLVDWLIRDLYTCPNVRSEMTDVYINAGPARPMRAPGHPQGAWALEQMLDALAQSIGMDPVALRLMNIPAASQAREGTPLYTSTGLRQCLETGAKAFGWNEARQKLAAQDEKSHVRRGVGMAACLWFVGGGGPPSTIVVKLFSDGSVNLNMGASDLGTGTKTVMAMVVSEELGIKPELIQIESADTGTTQYATPSGGSKTIPTESPAVRAAAVEVKRQLLELAAVELQVAPASLSLNGGEITVREDPSKKLAIKDVQALKKRGVIVGVGLRGPNPENKVVNPFAAQFCEVEVNMGTGEVRILRFLGAHDSGRVMNRLTYDSQVIGGITMGIGLAMTEARVLDQTHTGKLVNRNWHDYKLPTSLDVPAAIVSEPIELEDTEANTAGAKGLGEPVTIPTAAAIANAVYHATGVRVTESPMTPVRLCGLLHGRKKEG